MVWGPVLDLQDPFIIIMVPKVLKGKKGWTKRGFLGQIPYALWLNASGARW